MSKKERIHATAHCAERKKLVDAARARRGINVPYAMYAQQTRECSIANSAPSMMTKPVEETSHREKVHPCDIAVDALVAKLVKASEVATTPAAKAAMKKEWDRLWKARTWLAESVRGYDDVKNEAIGLARRFTSDMSFRCVTKNTPSPPRLRHTKVVLSFRAATSATRRRPLPFSRNLAARLL